MSVLVELYDENEPLLNILNAMLLHPRKVVFIGGNAVQKPRNQRNLRQFFQTAGLDMETRFLRIPLNSLPQLAKRLADVVGREENAIIDVTGGSDLLLVAAGMVFAQGQAVGVAYGQLHQGYYLLEQGAQTPRYLPIDVQMSVAQTILMAGGQLLRYGHVSRDDIDGRAMDDIAVMFPFFQKHRAQWHAFTCYLQAANAGLHDAESLQVQARSAYQNGGTLVSAPYDMLIELSGMELLFDLRFNERSVSFRYADHFLRQCLSDAGIWLELYVYRVAFRCGRFDDVQISAVIGWEDAESAVENEVDVIATAGLTQLFISCKSGRPDWDALNEIVTLTRRFGSQCALPVLVTMNDLETADLPLCRRAASLGVTVLDGTELQEAVLSQRLCELADTWDRKTKVPAARLE